MSDNVKQTASVPVDLNRLVIPNPCTVGWDTMSGDDRKRHCSQCDRNVYNLSEMSTNEAVALIESTNERICGRLLRRSDGTVVTKECPKIVPQLDVRRRPLQFSIAKLLVLITVAAGCCAAVPIVGPKIATVVQGWFTPATASTSPYQAIEGEWEIAPEDEIGMFAE